MSSPPGVVRESESGRRSWPSGAAAPWLALAFLVLTSAGWLMGTPPGGSPDEAAHYVKAIGVGHGDLRGRPLPKTSDLKGFFRLSARQRANLSALFRGGQRENTDWQRRTSRRFRVPAGLSFSGFGCDFDRVDVSASCLDAGRDSKRDELINSYTGTYQPYPYLAPGLAMRLTHHPFAAMRLGRLMIALPSIGLLALAFLMLWDGGRGASSLAGLFVAVTPAALFFASSLNPSGPEIASSICFTAALLRLSRRPGQGLGVWATAALSGVVLVTSRSLGPAFAFTALVAVAVLVGPRRALAVLREEPRRALAAGGLVGMGALAGLGWEITVQPRPSESASDALGQIGPSFTDLGRVGPEAVGVVGWLGDRLPWPVYLMWGVMLVAVLVLAIRAGERRGRRVLGVLALLVLVGVLVFSITFRRTGAFGVQGRYVLPLLVILPLAAGELLGRVRSLPDQTRRLLLWGTAGGSAVAQALAWWAASRRFAVGLDGPWLFLGRAEWSPPGGWVPWVVVVLAGATCAALSGVAAARAASRAAG